jgi:hypothetical protein
MEIFDGLDYVGGLEQSLEASVLSISQSMVGTNKPNMHSENKLIKNAP